MRVTKRVRPLPSADPAPARKIVSRVRREPAVTPDNPTVSRVVRRVGRAGATQVPAVKEKPLYVVDFTLPWGALLQLYLMNSYLYYQMNRAVISDHDYDRLCMALLKGWDKGKHPHKYLITKDDLMATTGYAIQYPRVVAGAAGLLLENYRER